MSRLKRGSSVKRATVLVANATPMDCQLVSDAIQQDKHFRVVGRATNSSEVVSAVHKLQPDVAVISARLQDGAVAGLLALRRLRGLQTRTVLLSDIDERELVIDAFLNNARGIFCRTGSSAELRKCVQSVHNGEIWASNSQMEYIVDALMKTPAPASSGVRAGLTKREEEIVQLVATGLSNRDVSKKLALSQHTVKNNLSRIYRKLGISTRIELLLYVLSQKNAPETQNGLSAHVSYQISAYVSVSRQR
jgi:DNA-binding NarL/FixJ family response regulator